MLKITETNHNTEARFRQLAKMWDGYVGVHPWPPADKWLKAYFRQHKNFGGRDRAFYSEHFFAMLRHLEALLADGGGSGAQSAHEFCLQVKELGGDELVGRYRAQTDKGEGGGSGAAGAIPAWHQDALRARIAASGWNDDELGRFIAHQQLQPPTWLRIKSQGSKDAVLNDLRAADIALVHEDGLAIAVRGQSSLQKLASFERGLFEFQDWSSQQVARAMQIEPGMLVWDVCAGGGGKTMHCAALLQGKGSVFASDVREHKLAEIKRRAKRGKFFNIETSAWDGRAIPSFNKKYTIYFDRILVDAPCTGSGTWRRNPDGRYRAGERTSVEELQELQVRLLALGAERLKPGGLLTYATCSWFVDENERVTELFAAQNKNGLELTEQKLVGCPAQDADTMFIAVWRKPLTS